jgi:site-specific recombinase XerD
MLEELQRRNYSQQTTKAYLFTVRDFAKYFRRSPEELGPEHIREYQAHLFRVRKLAGSSVAQRTAALRFLFIKTLKRDYMVEHIPFPKVPLRLPTVLSPEEVTRLIDAAPNLLYRTILMTLYSTGMRRGELVQLKASDIDKELMLVHIREGKGKRDRNVPLSGKLLRPSLQELANWLPPLMVRSPSVLLAPHDGRRSCRQSRCNTVHRRHSRPCKDNARWCRGRPSTVRGVCGHNVRSAEAQPEGLAQRGSRPSIRRPASLRNCAVSCVGSLRMRPSQYNPHGDRG